MLVGAQGSEVQSSRVVWPLAGVSAVQKKNKKKRPTGHSFGWWQGRTL